MRSLLTALLALAASSAVALEPLTNVYWRGGLGVRVGPDTTNLSGNLRWQDSNLQVNDGTQYLYILKDSNDFDRAVLLNVPWLTFGVPGTEVWNAAATNYISLNFGANLGTRTNLSTCNINGGFVEATSLQAADNASCSVNHGYVGTYGAQVIGHPDVSGGVGCYNLGVASGSASWPNQLGQFIHGSSRGCMNFGEAYSPQIIGAWGNQARGAFNIGATYGTNTAAGQYNNARGSGNIGYSGGSSVPYGLQYLLGTYGSLNIGATTTGYDATGGSQWQSGSYGSFNLGFVGTTGLQSIVYSGAPGSGGWGCMNFGYVVSSGLQTNTGLGSINAGTVYGLGQQIMDSSSYGSFNHGHVLSSGVQAMYNSGGCQNIGYVTGGTQRHMSALGSLLVGYVGAGGAQNHAGHGSAGIGYVLGVDSVQATSGYGSLNVGLMASAGKQEGSSHGTLQVGYVLGTGSVQWADSVAYGALNVGSITDAGVQTNSGRGSVNFGSLSNGVQRMAGDGSLNLGYLWGTSTYQTNTANGAIAVGANNRNTHNYSAVFGNGVDSVETNSVAARKYYENGVALETKYAGLAGAAMLSSNNLFTGAQQTMQTNFLNRIAYGPAAPAATIDLLASDLRLYPGGDGFGGGDVEIWNNDITQAGATKQFSVQLGSTPIFWDSVEVKTNLTVGGTVAAASYKIGSIAGLTYSHSFIDKSDITNLVCYSGGIVTNLFTNGVSVLP